MRNPKIITIFFLILLLPFVTGGCGNKSPFKDPPLKDEMAFSYQETTVYKGRTSEMNIDVKFVKKGYGMFNCIETKTDKNGVSEQYLLEVDGFFKYNVIMDTLVSSHPLWLDPKLLASSKANNIEVIEGTYNGKSVYVYLVSPSWKGYYDKVTGFLEGGEVDTGKLQETLVRIDENR